MITNNCYNEAVYSSKHRSYINYQITEQGENHYGEEQYYRPVRQVSKRKDTNNERADRRKLV